MSLPFRGRGLILAVALLVVFSLPVVQHVLLAYAYQPSLIEIFSNLGFTNVTQLTVETFPAGTYNITLYAKFGGDNPDYVDVNELSYYHVNTSSFNVLFTPSESTIFGYVTPPLTKTFSAGYQFGLSLLSWRSTRYFTETALNPDGNPHAKVYMNLNDPSMLLIAFDERTYCTEQGDWDFNDRVFSLQPQYYLNVVSPYDTPTGQGWYDSGTNSFASLADGVVDHANGTRRVFSQWSNDASGTNYSKSDPIYMDQNKTALAVWNTQYYLTVTTSPLGIAAIPGQGWYDQSTSTPLTAPSVAGYAFVYWDVDGAPQGNGTNPVTVNNDGPHTATAHYLQTYTLKIEAGPGGSTNPPPGTYAANADSTFQVTASPSANYAFDHWELDGIGVGSSNPYSVLMDGNHTLRATFKALPPLSVTISPTSATIHVGQSVNFVSEASGGTSPYTYQWYLSNSPIAGATSSSWTFTPSATGTYSVYLRVTDANNNVAQSQTVSVTVTAAPFSVSISPLNSSILLGQSVTFTSTVDGGTSPYRYQWYLDGSSVIGATSDAWTLKPSAAGVRYVYLRVTDAGNNTVQSETARVAVVSVPVGGYTVSFDKYTTLEPLTFNFGLVIMLAMLFVSVERKKRRRY